MVDNLTNHMDQLDAALGFLEDSRSLDNTIELLFGEDDDEEKSKKKEEPWEIDLSGLRDDLLEIISDRLMAAHGTAPKLTPVCDDTFWKNLSKCWKH